MKTYLFFISLVIIVGTLFLLSCKKEEIVEKPEVYTNTISDITANSAKSGGKITNDGGRIITARGVCWNVTGSPTIADSTSNNGNCPGSFVSQLTGLTAGLTYYVRAYLTTIDMTVYGNEQSFDTQSGTSTISTTSITDITANSATIRGEISYDGGADITARGVCWNIVPGATISDNKTTNGIGTGSFISRLVGLAVGTTYYVRAYSTNSVRTTYGNELTFCTQSGIPTLTTMNINSLTSSSAMSGGDISSNGGADIITRGICWNTTGSPTITDNKTSEGNETNSFTSQLTGLIEGTTVYVRAYATTTYGIGYGNEESFSVPPPCGSDFIDSRDSKMYQTVKIGEQCWMAENLNVGTKINGVDDQTDNGTIEKYCYNNDEGSCDVYGGLYQWNEMMGYESSSSSDPSGVRGICPSDWHVPSDAEWKELELYLGMSQSEVDNTIWRGTNQGDKLKSTSGWNSGGNGNNSSGFSALPGSSRNLIGEFHHKGSIAHYWSATELNNYDAWERMLFVYYKDIGRDEDNEGNGFSVRCIRD